MGELRRAQEYYHEKLSDAQLKGFESVIEDRLINNVKHAMPNFKYDFLEKYLVDIAHLDEELFKQCCSVLDGLWRSKKVYDEMLDLHDTPSKKANLWDSYIKEGSYLIVFTEKRLHTLYTSCTGVSIELDHDRSKLIQPQN